MRISTRGRYGLRAMVELAMAFGKGPVPLKEIATKQGLSEHYLEQLMGSLRKAGIVKSVRGAQGGYQLAKSPAEISTGEVLRVLEGPVSPVECVDQDKEITCENIAKCPTRPLWLKIYEQLNQVIDNTTLEDLKIEAQRLASQPESDIEGNG